MASCKILLFEKNELSDGTCPIYLRLIFERAITYIMLAKVLPKQWDESNNLVRRNHKNYNRINKAIKEKDSMAYGLIVDYNSGISNYTKDQIILKLKGKKRTETLPEYIDEYVQELRDKHQNTDASSKVSMKATIIKFNNKRDDLRFATITQHGYGSLISICKGKPSEMVPGSMGIERYSIS